MHLGKRTLKPRPNTPNLSLHWLAYTKKRVRLLSFPVLNLYRLALSMYRCPYICTKQESTPQFEQIIFLWISDILAIISKSKLYTLVALIGVITQRFFFLSFSERRNKVQHGKYINEDISFIGIAQHSNLIPIHIAHVRVYKHSNNSLRKCYLFFIFKRVITKQCISDDWCRYILKKIR